MEKIRYESTNESLAYIDPVCWCVTKCDYMPDTMVGSYKCGACKYHESQTEGYVECSYEKESK